MFTDGTAVSGGWIGAGELNWEAVWGAGVYVLKWSQVHRYRGITVSRILKMGNLRVGQLG